MLTNKITVGEAELLEFYLCGLRTGYSSIRETRKDVGSELVGMKIISCVWCPSFHAVPEHQTTEEILTHAETEYENFLHTLMGETYRTKPIPAKNDPLLILDGLPVTTTTTPTDVITIHSYK